MKAATLLLFSVFITNSFAQNISQSEAQDDLEYIINALDEGHPALYWHNKKSEYKNALEKAAKNLRDVSDIKGLHFLLNDIINTISCGHTGIRLPESHYAVVDSINKFIPFNINLVENKILVSESFCDDLSKGDQILSINGEPIDKVIDQLMLNIAIDKGIQTKRTRVIELVFPYYYAIYNSTPNLFQIEYARLRDRQVLTAEIEAVGMNVKMNKSALDYVDSQHPLRWSIEESSNVGILKLSTFRAQQFKAHEIDFKDTIQSIFGEIDQKNVKNLIIDLRWNNGGTMPLAEYLFSYFIDSTHTYYKDALIKQKVMEGATVYSKSRNMLPMLEKQFGNLEASNGIYILPGKLVKVEPTSPKYSGNLILLTNGLSFSATSSFIANIKEHKKGIVVGETPGGAYNGLNAGPQLMVELPNSKIRLYFRAISTSYNVNINKEVAEVDIMLNNTLESFLGDTDYQLEYVLSSVIK